MKKKTFKFGKKPSKLANKILFKKKENYNKNANFSFQLSSMLIIWAQNVYYLYAARILTGFVGGGLSVGVPALVNDISHDHVRAALNSVYDPCFNSGLIVTFFLGSYLSCLDQAKVQLIPSIIFLIILFFLPESPEFWSSRNKEKVTKKSDIVYTDCLRDKYIE